MRILFGIQGTGNGHLSRCHRIASELKKHTVEVDYVISGRSPEQLFNVDVFGSFKSLKGFSFTTKNGGVSYSKTLLNNSLPGFVKEVRQLDVKPYDLVVSDFEPVTAWAAKYANKRCIGIGRQYAFKEKALYQQLNRIERMFIDGFAPAREWLGMHWCPMGNCLPPVVRKPGANASSPRQILVYLPFERLYQVIDSLLAFDNYTFSVFHPDIKKVKYFSSGHIVGFPASRETFAEQLTVSSAVIANAGFETTCESLNSGKKLAIKPLKGQFEQLWNAKLLQQDGLASVLNGINEKQLRPWFEQLDSSTENHVIQWNDVAVSLAQWLAEGAKKSKSELSKELWNGSPGWIRTNDTWINSPPL